MEIFNPAQTHLLIQSHWEEIKIILASIDRSVFLAMLPNVIIEDRDVCKSLPTRMPAIYFLTHAQEGLLYVGKSKNVRSRWMSNAFQEHDCLEASLQLENVVLCWWMLPEELLAVIEPILIDLWKPKWNGHGSGKTRMKEEARQKAWEEA